MDLAQRVFAAEVGDPSTAEQVAAAATRICEKLTRYLASIVGQSGIRTLIDRSLTLTRKAFPWLPSVVASSEGSPWATLQARLAGRDAAEAREAFTTFLTSFIALFGRLIGEALVARLLHEIWPELSSLEERT